MSDKITFEQWLGKLTKHAGKCGLADYIIETRNCDSWQRYYNDGYSPEDALFEDLTYADN